jgi:hypothetical protein
MKTMLLLMAMVPAARQDIETTIVYVDPRLSFIVVDKGEKAGLGSEFDYEVLRDKKTIGSAVFEKFLGGQNSLAKLKVEDGTIGKMQVGDKVLCRRKG